VVVDPEGTEINQANLRYAGLPYTTLKLGRQEIEHRPAPLHRWIGNILWRQNWQSFDGFRVLNEYLPATVIDYAYVWNTNRIFGEDNPLPDRSDFRMDSHFLRAVYSGFSLGKIEAYSYLLDFESDTSAGLSTQTYGGRFEGAYDIITYPVTILYTVEYANQSDYGDNPADINVSYYLGELGATYTFIDSPIESVTVKGSYEVLEGDGPELVSGCCGGRVARALQTPLGTEHAFQGWADRFLINPADGIEDLFVTLNVKVLGANFLVMWPTFRRTTPITTTARNGTSCWRGPSPTIFWSGSSTPITTPRAMRSIRRVTASRDRPSISKRLGPMSSLSFRAPRHDAARRSR
jgi:hypothetical protein